MEKRVPQNKASWVDQNWKVITLVILAIAGWTNLRLAVKELQVQMKMVLTHMSISKTAKTKDKADEVFRPVSSSIRNHSND